MAKWYNYKGESVKIMSFFHEGFYIFNEFLSIITKHQNETKQNKTKQNKTKQNKANNSKRVFRYLRFFFV